PRRLDRAGGWLPLLHCCEGRRARASLDQPSSCTMIRLRWISSSPNWTAAALADATSGASTSPRISPLARSRTTRQRRFIRPASFAGLSFFGRRDGIIHLGTVLTRIGAYRRGTEGGAP